MNAYFLVEGKRTERKVYPKWLSLLIPDLKFVNFFEDVVSNNYKIFSGDGFPHLLHRHLKASIEDVNDSGNYNYFIICLDADDCTAEERVLEVNEFIVENNLTLNDDIEFRIIVQQKCIESWLLGNRNVFKSNPSNPDLVKAIQFYNVSTEDPELMDKPASFAGSTSDFHYNYLKAVLRERHISYTKKNPRDVTEKHYLEELIARTQDTGHLKTFNNFLELCAEMRSKID
ncbi:hypothetical protein BTO09_13830 [Gilvibacter sp. SZ-19]|uniref:hypothetical protein n=1 Tax=Gilvibacter sp. SZ-19 TaxID=754429 RepID=UPI000B3BF4BE|nr:hypothetical protein [Gilvibacter sp. SZ-19]ARV13353.1 hypothetical protein BTO09_13830 [Gilvibacter sp. SZ-19]